MISSEVELVELVLVLPSLESSLLFFFAFFRTFRAVRITFFRTSGSGSNPVPPKTTLRSFFPLEPFIRFPSFFFFFFFFLSLSSCCSGPVLFSSSILLNSALAASASLLSSAFSSSSMPTGAITPKLSIQASRPSLICRSRLA